MSNITITHADTGVVRAEVVRSQRISPSFVRVTLGGEDLPRFRFRGFDQWFRLALPGGEDARFDNLPQTFGVGGYLKYLTLPRHSRPVIRNYTVRAVRPELPELDIDFVVHGTEGVAGPWAASARPGEAVAFIDQGCGWRAPDAPTHVLVSDESGLPAVAGVLRDMPRDAVGHAIIEVPDAADVQEVGAPHGMAVQWVVREHGHPGAAALEALRTLPLEATASVFAVGESALATGARRWAVAECGVPKSNVTFSGYWKAGRSQ